MRTLVTYVVVIALLIFAVTTVVDVLSTVFVAPIESSLDSMMEQLDDL